MTDDPDAPQTITLVGCAETPAEYQRRVGEFFTFDAGSIVPRVGWEGRFMGVPGRFIAHDKFEIRPVDMRTTARKRLDEAAELLQPPQPYEPLAEVGARHAKAHHLLLLAQLDILRRMEARS